MSIDGYC